MCLLVINALSITLMEQSSHFHVFYNTRRVSRLVKKLNIETIPERSYNYNILRTLLTQHILLLNKCQRRCAHNGDHYDTIAALLLMGFLKVVFVEGKYWWFLCSILSSRCKLCRSICSKSGLPLEESLISYNLSLLKSENKFCLRQCYHNVLVHFAYTLNIHLISQGS